MRHYGCYRPRFFEELIMNTPICDFVAEYLKKNNSRLHMPGHKGIPYLGCEPLDITEIVGADSLYDASGIIQESEQNASKLFGARTFYSTEGSSHAIRAMLALTCQYAKELGKEPLVWAGRNVHSSFISAAALLDFSVKWLYSAKRTYLSCPINANVLDEELKTTNKKPVAVYVTSPDYLGNQVDIKGLADVCHKYGILLLVDNAHGAYLKFLPCSLHPMDLGADLCCDSAHKTLPVLTGGAYLHLSKNGPAFLDNDVKEAFRIFGSTSPSYLILQSLDMANSYLNEEYLLQLNEFLPLVETMKKSLIAHGYTLVGTEPLKLTISTKDYGYTGVEMAELLAKQNIIVEFFDSDYIVFMLTPSLGRETINILIKSLTMIPQKKCITEPLPFFSYPQKKMGIREAMLAPFETLPIEQCLGKVLARASVGCPPAVPILVCGEVIDEKAIACFQYYGINSSKVVKNHTD